MPEAMDETEEKAGNWENLRCPEMKVMNEQGEERQRIGQSKELKETKNRNASQ